MQVSEGPIHDPVFCEMTYGHDAVNDQERFRSHQIIIRSLHCAEYEPKFSHQRPCKNDVRIDIYNNLLECDRDKEEDKKSHNFAVQPSLIINSLNVSRGQ